MKTSRERTYHFLGFIFGVLFVLILQSEPFAIIPLFGCMLLAFLFGEIE